MRRTVSFLLAVILALGVGFVAGRAEGMREAGHTVVTLEVLPTPPVPSPSPSSLPPPVAAAALEQIPKPTPQPTPEAEEHYILNTRSKKFHYPDCQSVTRMEEHNKKYFTGPRSEVIEQGYVPCQNCKP